MNPWRTDHLHPELKSGKTSLAVFVANLSAALAQTGALPSGGLAEVLAQGCLEGRLVLNLPRADKSLRTFWRQRPDEMVLKDPTLEIALPAQASLSEILTSLLVPGALPGLWTQDTITFKDLLEYFSGSRMVQMDGEEEALAVPKAERAVAAAAVGRAVREGKLWLTNGPASIWNESVPSGLLTEEALLQAPPPVIASTDILPTALPEVWDGDIATAMAISMALSQRAGCTLPWQRVREAIDAAYRAHYVETTLDSATWPCEYPGAQAVKLRLPLDPRRRAADAALGADELKALAAALDDLAALSGAAGGEFTFRLHIELQAGAPLAEEAVNRLNARLRGVKPDLELKKV